MKCEKCGFEIPSGKMFCVHCGNALQIVPDFDTDRDEGIAVSSDEVQDALLRLKEVAESSGSDTIRLPLVKGNLRFLRYAAASVFALLFIVAAILLFLFIRNSRTNSLPAALESARSAFDTEDYATAVSEYERAMVLAKSKDSLIEIRDQISLAEALNKTGRVDDAVSLLRGVIVLDPENDLAYGKLIEILKDKGDYESINKLIALAGDENIYSKYEGYLTMPPGFDTPGGEYDEEFDLSLSTEYGADIYYTLDGSVPDSTSELYLGPLHIGEGESVVTAVCINGYDMASPPVSMKYNVKFILPPDPRVEPDEGSFSQPKYISIFPPEEGVKVVYTTDGTDPDITSEEYTHPIPMLLGKSTLKFRSISDKGVSGNVISKEYNLNVQSVCSSADATSYVAASLAATGFLTDIYGNAPGINGHYKYLCTKAAREGSRTYFIVDEYIEDSEGVLTETENAYAVDVISCMMYRAKMRPDGRYGFTLFY